MKSEKEKWFYPLQKEADKLITDSGYKTIGYCLNQTVTNDRAYESWLVTNIDRQDKSYFNILLVEMKRKPISVTLYINLF